MRSVVRHLVRGTVCCLLVSFVAAAPPPGINPASVTARREDDPRATVTLAEVLAPRLLPMVGPAANEPSPLDRLAADPTELQAKLQRGRRAVEQRRWLEAVSELEGTRAAGVTDVELNRLLARAYIALGSPTRAAEEWRRVLIHEPDDLDALFEVGVSLVEAREPDLALDPLLRLWKLIGVEVGDSSDEAAPDRGAQPEQAQDVENSRPERAARRAVTAYVLAEALRQCGFDRAGAEAAFAAVRSVADPATDRLGADRLHGVLVDERLALRVAEVRRRVDFLLRSAAEAFLRCGDCDAALDALAQAEQHERPTAAQRARRLAAYRCAGRPDEALRWWIRSLGSGPDRIERGDVALAEWLAAWLGEAPRQDGTTDESGSALANALRDGTAALLVAHPDNATLLAVAAAVLPAPERAALLQAGVRTMPADPVLLGQALRAIADLPGGLSAALDLATERVVATPQTSAWVAAQLSTLPASPEQLVTALTSESAEGAGRAVPAALLLRAELRVLWNDPTALNDADAIVTDDPAFAPAILALRARAAASIEAPEHAFAVATAVRSFFETERGRPSAPLVGAVAEALVRAGDPEAAWAFVEPHVRAVLAVDRELSIADGETLATAAEVALATAASLPQDAAARSSRLSTAERLARAALVEDPGAEIAWRVLLTLLDPEGAFLPDAGATAALAAELDRLVRGVTDAGDAVERPGLEPLLRRLEIQADATAGRRDDAIAALVQLVDADPTDGSAIELLGELWRRGGEADQAFEWFRARSARQPSNPLFAREALDSAIAAARSEEAVRQLQEQFSAEPTNAIVDALLGRALAAADEMPAARAHDRARLERRPGGPQRDLELARVEAAGDRIDRVVELLESVSTTAAAAVQRRGALVVAAGLDRLAVRDPRRVDALIVDLVNRVLADDPALPLSVHTAALVAEVRRGTDDRTLQRMLDRALASPPGRLGSPESIRGWLGMAQAMVGLSRGDLAAVALRRRLAEGPPPEVAAEILLRSAALTADIASRDVEGTVARVPALRRSALEMGYPPILTEESERDAIGGGDGDAIDAEILVWLSSRWTLLDDDAGAEQLLREALRRHPRHAMAANNLGWMLLELDDTAEPSPEVVELIESAAAALPASASVIDSLGWLRFRQGQLADENDRPGAVTLLRRAVHLAGEQTSAELLDHLGDALWAAGELSEARSTWRRGVTMIDRTAPRDQMLTVLLDHQQREYGLVLIDPRELYERLYGRVRERMVEKLLAARGGDPSE